MDPAGSEAGAAGGATEDVLACDPPCCGKAGTELVAVGGAIEVVIPPSPGKFVVTVVPPLFSADMSPVVGGVGFGCRAS